MYMVLMLHIMDNGGILEKVEWLSGNYFTGMGLYTASFCAVDCYALISGYICYGSKFDYARIIRLWMQVIFYTVGITVLFAWMMPEEVGIGSWICAFFPVTRDQYWYVSSYFILFFCMPFLNFVVDRLDRRQFNKLLLTLFILTSVIPTFLLRGNAFLMNYGFSPVWLGVLYLLGAYVKKYNWLSGLSCRMNLLLFTSCCILVLMSKVVIEVITSYLFGVSQKGNILMAYNSPFIVACALFLFMACLKKTYGSPKLVACIAVLAPFSFGVYLFHCQCFVVRYWLNGAFASYAELPPWGMLLAVLLTVSGIYLAGSLIDFIRMKIFQICGLHAVSNRMLYWIRRWYRKVFC